MENTYPICKPHDLIKYYRDEIDLEITMDQFTNPTAEVWFDNYLHIVARVFRLQPGELQEKLRFTPANLENSYLYEAALTNVRFSLIIRKLLNNIGCRSLTDFNLLDLKKPSKKSIVHTLSPFLNFLRFQESQKEPIENILVNQRAEQDKNVMLKDKVRVLQQQLEEKKNREKEIDKAIKTSQSKDHELMDILKANKMKLEMLKESHLKIDDEKKELLALLERKTNQRDELRNRSRSAMSRIVQSPMRLQHDIQLQKSMQPELQKQYEDLRKEHWQAREHVREMTEARDAVVRMNEKRREIEKTLIEIKEKKELHAKRRAEVEEGFARLDKLKRQAEQLEAEIVRKREELYKTDNIHEDKLARIVSELNRLKLEDVKMKEAIEKKKKEINSIVERIDGVGKQIKAEQELGEAVCNKIVKSLMDYQESATKEIFSKTYEDVERDVDKWIAEDSEN